jgi:hypothetical protein
MAGGELAAAFEGLAGDAGQAGGDIANSIASFTEDTADIEDGNIARTLAADADAARAAASVRPDVGDLAPDVTGTGGWAGARYVESSTPEEEAAYAAIRASTGDVPEIADNTGISQDVIAQVKVHLFLTEHDVPVGPGEIVRGYFTPDGEVASLWAKAEDGSLTPGELDSFRSLMAHEYVESRLMESGLPYRSADPEAWDDGEALFSPSHFGAHEAAPLASDGSLRLWPRLGLTPPDAPIASDLSNIDEVVSAARRGLGL